MAKTYTWRTYLEDGAPKELVIPEDYTEIEKETFRDCRFLQSVTIPKGVKKIGWRVFDGCTSLRSITIPKGVAEIGWFAFGSCTSLQSLTILNPNIIIGKTSFSGCSALTEVNLPKGLTRSKVKSKFADSPWGKNKPRSGTWAAEKVEKEKEKAIDALSASEIVKQALDEVAPQSATTVANSETMPISLTMNLMEGIKLNLTLTVNDTPDGFKQFASSFASNVRELINFFSNLFVGNSKEYGTVSISGNENDLVLSMKLNYVASKGGNFVNLNAKDLNYCKFMDVLSINAKKIEDYDSKVEKGTRLGVSILNIGDTIRPLVMTFSPRHERNCNDSNFDKAVDDVVRTSEMESDSIDFEYR